MSWTAGSVQTLRQTRVPFDESIRPRQCQLGRQHGHPDTQAWVETLRTLASRTGMKELLLRSLLHGAALGNQGDATAAAILAAEIEDSR